ncbi:TonB-dependent receptor [Carboxylicivirga sediminis]|uniref:TonB-dependent receptor n=1 Tax=Carboxylicivirga sediminis TaxID=2006564 RepID=A0A941IWD6_9BACT|nr:TonB-dependent receptor [Carboxylicivirga sediminis]MBR8534314.1 TonB-dependent receptor [Carboxylicivirga sediminis]
MQRYILLFIYIICYSPLYAQSKQISVSTHIIDEKSDEPVPFAAIIFTKVNVGTYAAYNGTTLPVKLRKGNHEIQVSCIGYNTASANVTLTADTTITIKLQSDDININEVVVTATDNEGPGSGSKINRKAIEHIQASSFADVMQLVPGGKSQEPDLSKVNPISIRQVGSDVNTALGTAFILDGAPISNEANMLAPEGTASDIKLDNRTNVSNGMDMRSIPTDQIESIEVIQGIPSVVHGDLSTGAIIINQRHGITPWQGRIKSDARNKLFSLGKGIDLGQKAGTINFNGDYLIFNSDPRNPYEGYQRYTFSSRYFNHLQLANSSINIKGNLSYTGSADKDRNDPEIDDQANDQFRTNYNSLSYTLNTEWNFNSWFQQVILSSRASYASNKLYRQKFISNGGPMPAPINTAAGESYGIYLPATYEAFYRMEDKPLNVFNQLSARLVSSKGVISHSIVGGLEWRYDKNLGQGEIYDLERPMYPSFRGSYSVSTRPRDLSSIPSVQKLAFFAEDNMNASLGEHKIDAQLGIRGTNLLNLSDTYDMSGKIYLEPRLNMQYTLPDFSLNKQNVQLSIHGGIGHHYKFPTLNQLHPNELFFDLVQLNYYSQNPDLRSLHIKTIVENPTNYELQPASNLKWEFSLHLKVDEHLFYMTYFNERMNNGFMTQNQWQSQSYRLYNTDGLNPVAPPQVDDLPYTNTQIINTFSQTHNGAGVYKEGLEYQMTFARFNNINTRLTVNGAWFNTTYQSNIYQVFHPNRVINNQPFPYAGIYDEHIGSDRTLQQFNTNFQFDTQITRLGLIFTSTIECTWFSNSENHTSGGWPVAYIDVFGQKHLFTDQDKNDPILEQLYLGKNDEYFHRLNEPFGTNLNIRVSKQFKKGHNLSFYVNNLISYYPDYYNNYHRRIQRINQPYFGMELNINI